MSSVIMSKMKLDDTQIAQALAQLPGWTVAAGKLHREYRFPSFQHAIGFMTTAAIAIDKLDHHPEWANVYSRVNVELVTHSENGITEKDTALAQILEALAPRFA
jgi:4a-hydroxytetrahydrobiopterin dehydratase